jgi:hypothetical protein
MATKVLYQCGEYTIKPRQGVPRVVTHGLRTKREPDCTSELAIRTHITTIQVTGRLHFSPSTP